MSDSLTVGQASQLLGTSSKAIRYYESIGLLPELERSDNGYRRLSTHDIDRLRFITSAKALGLTLSEISTLVSVAEQGECKRITKELKDIVSGKIRECDERIASLSAFRDSLERLSQQINVNNHDHDDHGVHTAGHPPFSPECTCLPDTA